MPKGVVKNCWGGGGEGYYVWGEGHNILSTDLGRDFNFWTAFWGGS